jgi:hypothetical protein
MDRKMVFIVFLAGLASASQFGCVGEADTVEDVMEGSEEPVGETGQTLTTTCVIGQSCGGIITTTYNSVNPLGALQLVGKINMGASGYRRLDLFAQVCAPKQWVLHITDSPSANGWGGDGATTDHDAEGYLTGTTFEYFSAYDMSRGIPGAYVQTANAFSGQCNVVHMVAYHSTNDPVSYFSFTGGAPATVVKSPFGMKLGYTSCASPASPQRSIECDWENAALTDSGIWYVGINGTVGSTTTRYGLGTTKHCIVLGTDVNLSPPSCL